MKIVMIAIHDPNMYPGFYDLAVKISKICNKTYYISSSELILSGSDGGKLSFLNLKVPKSILKNVPWFRAGHDKIVGFLRDVQPDLIIAENEFLMPSIIYKRLFNNNANIASFIMDNERNRKYISMVKHVSRDISIQLECCDVLCRFRQEDWPKMAAKPFILRHAPPLREGARFLPHQGPARVVFTSSKYVLGLNRERLSRFLGRLCSRGISVDWYFPHQDENRDVVRTLLSHPLYTVRERVEKAQLLDTLSGYDVGLHWAPMAEQDYDYNYFQSTASNKIGEYVAAGLAVAYAGNPGLAFLPREISLVFDPTDPEIGADQLAAALADRAALEWMRAASLRYHQEELNIDAQAAPFLRYVREELMPRFA